MRQPIFKEITFHRYFVARFTHYQTFPSFTQFNLTSTFSQLILPQIIISSREPRQARRVREDSDVRPPLPQHSNDGERIRVPSRQVPQRALRGGQALLRLGPGQQRDRVPPAQRHLLLRENVRAYPGGCHFRHPGHPLPVRVEERLRGPRGEPTRPDVLLASRDPRQIGVPLHLFPRQTTIHRRSHGILRPGVAFQSCHPTRLAGHPFDHAPLRRLGPMRQTRADPPRDTAEQAERVRLPTGPGADRVPGTFASLPEISAENRDDRFREDA